MHFDGRARRFITGTVGLGMLLIVSGCDTYRGVSEFNSYRDTYTAAKGVGEGMLDRLAVSERTLYQTAYPFDPLSSPFEPSSAPYLVTSVDPPATAALRRTLAAVTSYNDALYALASGQEGAAIAGKITRLSTIGAGAADDLAALGAPELQKVGGVAAARAVNTVLAAFEPLAAQIIDFETRADFRKMLVAEEPTIRAALKACRDQTPAIFEGIRGAVVTRESGPTSRGTLSPAAKSQIDSTRLAIANWVVLLDLSDDALQAAVAAVKADPADGSLDSLLMVAGTLNVALHAARQNLAGQQ